MLTGRLLHFDDPAKADCSAPCWRASWCSPTRSSGRAPSRLVDRLFFSDWVAREADLARFAADARGFTEAAGLVTALVGALDRFTAGAGAALYVRGTNGRFACPQASTIDAPPVLDADEPLAVALRAGRSVARCDDVHSTLPGELAMVLSRQRELDAFILIGRQRDGRVLRSDEVAALCDALLKVGIEWQGLRWDALQREAGHARDAAA